MRLISELWKDIGVYKGIDYTGLYKVSSKGRIWDIRRNCFVSQYKERQTGYLRGNITDINKTRKLVDFHRIVAICFVLNPDPKHKTQVNHKDEDKTNNDVNNLEWVTPKENINYGTRTKRMVETQSISVVQLDMNGNFIKKWKSIQETGRNGFVAGKVCNCVKGKRGSHHGFKWMYLDDYEKLSFNY